MEDPLSSRRAPSPAVPSSPTDGGQRESSPLLDSAALMPEKVDDITDAVQQVEKLSIASDPLSASLASPTSHPLPPGASPIDPQSIRATPTSPPPFPSSSSPSPSSASSVPPPLPPDASFSSRLLHFHHCMNMERIPRKVICSFVFEYGSPDQKGMRSLLWKLLLNYLPWQHADWEESLKRNRAVYAKFVDELSTNPYKKMGGAASAAAAASASSPPSSTRVSVADDPLAAQSSEWSEYYKDEAIRHEIDKDVKRTYSSFHFFQERVRPIVITLEEARRQARQEAEQAASHSLFDNLPPPSSSLPVPPQADVTKAPPRKDDETHQDVIRRILFVYAKLNPGVRYVQGMNEILAPMYYVFAHDTHPLFTAPRGGRRLLLLHRRHERHPRPLHQVAGLVALRGVLAVVALINSYLQAAGPGAVGAFGGGEGRPALLLIPLDHAAAEPGVRAAGGSEAVGQPVRRPKPLRVPAVLLLQHARERQGQAAGRETLPTHCACCSTTRTATSPSSPSSAPQRSPKRGPGGAEER